MPQYHFVQSQITTKPLLAYPAYFSTGEGSILLRRTHAAIYVPCQITYVRSPMEVLRQWHKEWAALWKVMFDIPGRKISSQIHSKIPNDYIQFWDHRYCLIKLSKKIGQKPCLRKNIFSRVDVGSRNVIWTYVRFSFLNSWKLTHQACTTIVRTKCTLLLSYIQVIPPNDRPTGLMLTHYTHKPLAPAQ